jgi:hypothetical protein
MFKRKRMEEEKNCDCTLPWDVMDPFYYPLKREFI